MHRYSFEVSLILIFLSVSLLFIVFSVFHNIKINIEKAVASHMPPCGFLMVNKIQPINLIKSESYTKHFSNFILFFFFMYAVTLVFNTSLWDYVFVEFLRMIYYINLYKMTIILVYLCLKELH